MPLGAEAGPGPGDIVLDVEPAPLKWGTAPQFSAHVCFGQTAGWIKMPLDNEVDLSPDNIVLDGAQLPDTRKWAQQPHIFWSMSIVAKRSPISATAL